MSKRTRSFILILTALCMALCGCSLKKPGRSSADRDPSDPVISIWKEEVTLAMYRSLFDNYLPYMQYLGQDPLQDKNSLESYQDWIVDFLTDDLVTLDQAEQAGFKLSEEQERELASSVESDLKAVYDKLIKYAEQSFAEDPSVSVETYFESLVNSESEYYTGVAMSWEDYKNYFIEQARKDHICRAYRDLVCAEFEPSEEDIAGWYQSAHESDKANYADAPEKYKTDEENYEQYFGQREGIVPVTAVPAGYSRIMHIAVYPEGELSEEYSAKLRRMEELKKEYSDLAFEDAVNGTDANSARLKAILREYAELRSEADEEYKGFVAAAIRKINEAYGELLSGRPFAEVMLEYTEDERVLNCAAFAERGELISLDYKSEQDWSDTVKAEFAELSPGKYSEPFPDGDGYHIIFYVGDEPAGDVPMEKIYDDIKAVCSAGVQDAQWEELLNEWKKDPALKIDIDAIRSVGADRIGKE